MFKNMVTDRLHVIKDIRAHGIQTEEFRSDNFDAKEINANSIQVETARVTNRLDVDKDANIKNLTVHTVMEDSSGSFYGSTSLIKSLSTDPAVNKASGGVQNKAARVDHVHPIPEKIKNPYSITVKNYQGTKLFDYDGSVAKELVLSLANTGAAEKNHANSSTAYGVGSSTLYGHLKLSDAVNSNSGVGGGVAATPHAVQTTYNLCRIVFNNAAPTANVVPGTFWVGV